LVSRAGLEPVRLSQKAKNTRNYQVMEAGTRAAPNIEMHIYANGRIRATHCPMAAACRVA
jgi:hypothetical protein